MKITSVRTRVVEWRGKTVPLPPHFCTNPMDLLAQDLIHGAQASMATFTFHGWLIVEVFTDSGLVGIGNAALSPHVTKADHRSLPEAAAHRRRTRGTSSSSGSTCTARRWRLGRKGIGMVAISAVDIALWDVLGKAAGQPVYRLLGGRTKPRIPVYASRLYSTPLDELAAEAQTLQGRTAIAP